METLFRRSKHEPPNFNLYYWYTSVVHTICMNREYYRIRVLTQRQSVCFRIAMHYVDIPLMITTYS